MENEEQILIIAEAGVNHNGDLELAKEMVRKAREAEADYIKFQTFIPGDLVTGRAEKADYQKRETGGNNTQLEMLEHLALSERAFLELKEYCDRLGVGFLSTPFDLRSIDFLSRLDMDYWKVPSGEITNRLYLERIAHTGKKVILSTGMSELDEIRDALDILEKILQCNTEYPTPLADVNLLAMKQMEEVFHKRVGYSDHTQGIEIPIAATALGARVIEKHFTLDRNMEGPDHRASLEPDELAAMVRAIRNVERAMGDGKKRRTASEKHNAALVRKSIVASAPIKAGDLFTSDNITVKRPGTGISPMNWYEVLGKQAKRDYGPDEMIEKEYTDV